MEVSTAKSNVVRPESRPWCSEDGASRCDGMGAEVNGDVGTMVEPYRDSF
jgi:hypothetical protein